MTTTSALSPGALARVAPADDGALIEVAGDTARGESAQARRHQVPTSLPRSWWPTPRSTLLGLLGGPLAHAVGQPTPGPTAMVVPGNASVRSDVTPIPRSGGLMPLGSVGEICAKLSARFTNNSARAITYLSGDQWHHRLTAATDAEWLNISLSADPSANISVLGAEVGNLLSCGVQFYSLTFNNSSPLSAVIGVSSKDFPLTSLVAERGGNDASPLGLLVYNATGGMQLTVDNSTDALRYSARADRRATLERVTPTGAPARAPAPAGRGRPPPAVDQFSFQPAQEGGLQAATRLVQPSDAFLSLSRLRANVSYSLGEVGGVSATVDYFPGVTETAGHIGLGFSTAAWHHRLDIDTSYLTGGIALVETDTPGLMICQTNVSKPAAHPGVSGQSMLWDLQGKLLSGVGVYPDRDPGRSLLLVILDTSAEDGVACEATEAGWRMRAEVNSTWEAFTLQAPQARALDERSRVVELDSAAKVGSTGL